MEKFMLAPSFKEIWEFIKDPKFIIAYLTVMVLLMLFTVIAAMVNEKRFDNLTLRLNESADKAEEQAEKEASACRFEALKALDEQRSTYVEKPFAEDFTLAEFCESFRNFAAGKLGLYYDIKTIREFISGVAVSHFIILQGMSGTGKTSLAFAFGEFLENPSTIIPVQPMWKERSDLLGYYNEFTKRFNQTPLLQKMYEANMRKDIYITILDELNIARVEYYFAEFLSLMEIPDPELRRLEIISDRWENDPEGLKDGSIKLPENMWFLGTANNDDSTFAISDKVYDRTMIVDLEKKAEEFDAENCKTMPVSYEKFNETVKEVIAGNPLSGGIANRIARLDEYLGENFKISFGNRIMKQIKSYLPVYAACGGTEEEALDDILAKKVLRKLEAQNLSYRGAEAERLCKFLGELFGEGAMPRSVAAVRTMARLK